MNKQVFLYPIIDYNMKLDQQKIDSFHKNGYIVIENFFNSEELDDFKFSFHKIVKSVLEKSSLKDILYDFSKNLNDFDDAIIKLEKSHPELIGEIYDTIAYTPSFLRLIAKKDYEIIISQLFNEDYVPFYLTTNRCRIDPPQVTRRSTDWHQETFYTIPQSKFIQTWGPLVRDIKTENGAIEICIASHESGTIPQNVNLSPQYPTPYSIDESIVSKYEKKSIELELGSILFFSPTLFHRSGFNSSDTTRFSIIGMYHNTKNPLFNAPKINFSYRNMEPDEYYKNYNFNTQ